MGHLHGDGGAAAFAPGLQAPAPAATPRTGRITHRGIAGDAPQHGVALAIEAAGIDPRAWRAHAQRQLPMRSGANRMAPALRLVRWRSAPRIVPGDLQALATQRWQRAGIFDMQHETRVAGPCCGRSATRPRTCILRRRAGWQLACRTQCPCSVAQARPSSARPGTARQRNSQPPAPAIAIGTLSHSGSSIGSCTQASAPAPGLRRSHCQTGPGRIDREPFPSLPLEAAGCLSTFPVRLSAPYGTAWKLTRKLAPPPALRRR
jgi:hypothetical protein